MAYQTRKGRVVLVASGRRGHVLPPAVRQEMGRAGIIRAWCHREHGASTSFTELDVFRFSLPKEPKEHMSLQRGAGARRIRQHGQTRPDGTWADGSLGGREAGVTC